MGRKRYYCDFCDKSFTDNPQIRKKHNGGLQHSLAKRSHYAKFKGPDVVLAEDEGKEKCRRFMTTGECQFGDNCRYSHITPDIHQQLVTQAEANKTCTRNSQQTSEVPDLDTWLVKQGLKDIVVSDIPTEQCTEDSVLPEPLPDCLKHIPIHELPPSLIPPSMRHYGSGYTPDWGE